jgi:hypothetical protein
MRELGFVASGQVEWSERPELRPDGTVAALVGVAAWDEAPAALAKLPGLTKLVVAHQAGNGR